MKAYWGGWNYSSTHSLSSALDGGVVSFMPRPLYPHGKSPWCPLDRRLGGLQSRSGRGGEEKNSRPLRDSNPQTSSPQLSAISLSYPRILLGKLTCVNPNFTFVSCVTFCLLIQQRMVSCYMTTRCHTIQDNDLNVKSQLKPLISNFI
jgi:hypothetical protein